MGGTAFDRAWWSALSIGMLGLEAPGDVQRLLHRTRRWMTGNGVPVDPLGWANQISAGGEPTALYRVGYQRQLAGDSGIGRRKHWQVVGDVEGAVGYATTATGSLSARLGAFTTEFWQSPRGLASAAVAAPGHARLRRPALGPVRLRGTAATRGALRRAAAGPVPRQRPHGDTATPARRMGRRCRCGGAAEWLAAPGRGAAGARTDRRLRRREGEALHLGHGRPVRQPCGRSEPAKGSHPRLAVRSAGAGG